MQHTSHTKLQAIRDSRKRWQTRLTRATNMLRKLDQRERRLLAKEGRADSPASSSATVTSVNPPVPVISVSDPDLVEKVAAALESSRDDGLKIPAFLSRKPDEGTAIAAKKTAVDKTKMPLSDKAAKDYIRKQSIAVEKKREKKDRAFFKAEA